MSVGPGYGMPPGGHGRMLASSADRERTVDLLKAGFAEGRLNKDEYDARVGRAYAARTYDDLAVITADLPGSQPPPWPPAVPEWRPVPAVARTNGYAIASLACAIGQPFTGGLTTIPAIVCGHIARGQIRRTGEEGLGLATAGLVLGWAGALLGILLFLGLAVTMAHAAPHVVFPHS